jgi:hypothetical protein
MYAIQGPSPRRLLPRRHLTALPVGSALDVSTLVDFLPAYLYPRNERTVEQWGVAGFSLGGHSTWIAAKNGAPSHARARARHNELTNPFIFRTP